MLLIIKALLKSCIAPDTISEAEAEPLFTSITSGISKNFPSPVVKYSSFISSTLPFTELFPLSQFLSILL
ncbi:hypothetical protein ATZ36_08610 [Candidatus Endomicrobiellum trichonymphae]|uniref:Uncharacterized protein n=1 Tax=Endomicrobium trichonymphae TaxID=1408204 RepID=A0A1E5IGS7_ENDTX|nr:hypothetical protein ATZ36_08610 [Candidatus Endomicrobium trichonymphae]